MRSCKVCHAPMDGSDKQEWHQGDGWLDSGWRHVDRKLCAFLKERATLFDEQFYRHAKVVPTEIGV